MVNDNKTNNFNEEQDVITEMLEVLDIEEEDRDSVEITYDTSFNVGFYRISYGRMEYLVFEDFNDAGTYAKGYVTEMIETEGLETFNQNFIESCMNDTIEGETFKEYVASEAVREDGVAHFLATYDSDETETKSGFYAYRTN